MRGRKSFMLLEILVISLNGIKSAETSKKSCNVD